MKIRSGFVSNSSSSSFIVGFPKNLPDTPEKLEIMMFGKKGGKLQLYDFLPETSNLDIAKRVLSDITGTNVKKYTKKQLIRALAKEHCSFPGCPTFRCFRKDLESDKIEKAYLEETGKNVWDETADPKVKKHWRSVLDAEKKQEDREFMIAAQAFVEGFWPRVKGMTVFELSYSDNGGEAHLEHGNIFRNFPHIRISNH